MEPELEVKVKVKACCLEPSSRCVWLPTLKVIVVDVNNLLKLFVAISLFSKIKGQSHVYHV